MDGYPVTGIGNNSINTNSISFKNKLTSVVLPNSLQFIGYGSFKDCTLLKSVTIPDSVVFIRPDAFKNCTSLASITIPDSVTTIDNDAFKGCTSLKEVSIPNTVIDIGPYIFGGCTNITKVTIDSNAIGVGMFYGCISLTTVNIGDNVEFIGAESFVGCESLDSIIIPDSVQYIDHAVFIGSNISSIIFYNPNTVFEEGIDEVFTIYPRGPTFDRCENLRAIYAFTGTQAQRYAIKNQLDFIQISKVQLNGIDLKFDVPPQVMSGRTLVPMRQIFEELGADIIWDDNTQTVTAKMADKSITMQIDNPHIQVNGNTITLDIPPQMINNRTLAPIRAISESLGAIVGWVDETQTVTISTR